MATIGVRVIQLKLSPSARQVNIVVIIVSFTARSEVLEVHKTNVHNFVLGAKEGGMTNTYLRTFFETRYDTSNLRQGRVARGRATTVSGGCRVRRGRATRSGGGYPRRFLVRAGPRERKELGISSIAWRETIGIFAGLPLHRLQATSQLIMIVAGIQQKENPG